MIVTELMALQMRYDLPLSLAKILLLLVENQVVTTRMIELDHAITKDAKVAIHRLRRRLAATPIEIKHRRDVGYWLEKEARELAHTAMQPTENLPLGDGGRTAADGYPQQG
jgi:hypothetical protein